MILDIKNSIGDVALKTALEEDPPNERVRSAFFTAVGLANYVCDLGLRGKVQRGDLPPTGGCVIDTDKVEHLFYPTPLAIEQITSLFRKAERISASHVLLRTDTVKTTIRVLDGEERDIFLIEAESLYSGVPRFDRTYTFVGEV